MKRKYAEIRRCVLSDKIKVINYFCINFEITIKEGKIILNDILLSSKYEINEDKINKMFDFVLRNFNLFDIERVILGF